MNNNPNHGSSRKKDRMNVITRIAPAAVLIALGLILTAWAAEPPPVTSDLLKDKFTVPSSECRGWGRWETPWVTANNSSTQSVQLPNRVTLPAGGVMVHPGQEQDVTVRWESPITGEVTVAGRVRCADPAGGDGVSWAIVHVGKAGRKMLAQGVIDRGGSAAADAGKLASVPVQQGDSLVLVVGRRESYHYDSTAVEFTVTETGGAKRVWDLAKDIAADIHAGNPHADSFGNKAVWYLLAPRGRQGTDTVEDSLMAARLKVGRRIESWTVATDDTKLTVGATDEGQLVIYELSNPAAGWNWTAEPSVLPLVKTVGVGTATREIRWKFKDGKLDKTDGQKATLVFGCDEPALELASEWWARPGRGPVRHALRIANRSNGPVKVFDPPTLHLDLAAGNDMGELAIWTFHTGGATPDKVGVYRNPVQPPFSRQIRTHAGGEFIPYAVFDAGGKQGLYIGIEWGYCRVACVVPEDWSAGTFRVRSGEFDGFSPVVEPGETFVSPPGFIGAYKGDVDDAGNSLRRYLFACNMPEIVRKDATYPKVQWNAFGATGDKPGGWNSVESKYYPMVDAIAPLGFEEIMLDVGWWEGGTKASEPKPDPVDWPSGMAKAAEHAHKAGMRFGLYWNKGEAMASAEGRQRRMAHIRRLYEEHKADMWRSDSTAGPVVGRSYVEVRGFYDMLDQLYREMPNFQWENCDCGGRLKDFGSMKRSVKIFITDTYAEHHVRQAFYDASFIYPPAQLMGCVGSTDGRFRPKGIAGMKFAFRSTSLGAPEWFIDAPTGMNGSAPWTDDERAAVKAAVATYKTRIRPLVRNADLYHILPRPDGKNWDGIQYHDPATGKGVVYLFKPSPVADTITIKLRGVDPARHYRVSFEDGSNPAVEKTGAELAKGLEITLKGAPVSELVWIEEMSE